MAARSSNGFIPIIEAYQKNPPTSLQLLENTTWGELAERYGDKTIDEMLHLMTFRKHK